MTKRLELYKIEIPCPRGKLIATSTVDLAWTSKNDNGKPVVIHAGMGKAAELYSDLIYQVHDEGYIPIVLDTRWFETEKSSQDIKPKRLSWIEQILRRKSLEYTSFDNQPLPNPENSYSMRRVHAVEHGLVYLGLDNYSLLGHSEGARVLTKVALRNPKAVSKLVLVNPASAGSSWHGYKRLIRSNVEEIKALRHGEIKRKRTLKGGLVSTLYTLRNPLRTIQEKRVIQATSIWPYLDQLNDKNVPITILAARDDKLVSFQDIQKACSERKWVSFIPTDGRHTNVLYSYNVKRLVVQGLKRA